MMSLDDSGWSACRHAYGPAADVPGLLRALAVSPTPETRHGEEPWFSLWSSLCHQGHAYEASYLAVPHIVAIALDAAGPIDPSFLHLPAAVEIARLGGHGPEVPAARAAAYHGAVARLPDIVALHRHAAWDRSMLLAAAAALAVAKGHADVAEALLDLDDDWIARIVGDDRD